ncbi:Suf-domain-containing protein [Tilletiaria anomala UBC 951]|uniref:mRNA 3'-end-processing protein RNA14 n=1 Tax=Tilletiaria anomala (strain ATCC 24038 / CBS 436.72 / UBC 951) TaxID=1037660 RepID=A0A066VIF7_TILAU|nr:Suf-domain-containing protein [Tilletiaria anomala UBC 951]KDN40098.1 Suf-domain-containing protein [Tilletiaria anomala UBC 951]
MDEHPSDTTPKAVGVPVVEAQVEQAAHGSAAIAGADVNVSADIAAASNVPHPALARDAQPADAGIADTLDGSVTSLSASAPIAMVGSGLVTDELNQMASLLASGLNATSDATGTSAAADAADDDDYGDADAEGSDMDEDEGEGIDRVQSLDTAQTSPLQVDKPLEGSAAGASASESAGADAPSAATRAAKAVAAGTPSTASQPSNLKAVASATTKNKHQKPRVRFLDDDEQGLPPIDDTPKAGKKGKGICKSDSGSSEIPEAQTQQQQQPIGIPAGVPTPQASASSVVSVASAQLLGKFQQSATATPSPALQKASFAAFPLTQLTPMSTPTPAPAPVQSLAERIALLRSRVEKDGRDGEAWLNLVEAVQGKDGSGTDGDDVLQESKQAFEDMLHVFPYAVKQWIAYIDILLAHSDFKGVEVLFARCLRGISSVSVDLWRSYLSYTRRVNPIPPFNPTAREEYDRSRKVVQDAYEFALNNIGGEREAGPIWQEFIAFLKERKTGAAVGVAAQPGSQAQWEEGQKMDAIRNAFQRAVTQPTNEIERLWREYDAFENSMNRTTAKRFLAERSAAYMTARGAQREMASILDSLPKPLLPRVPAWVSMSDAGTPGRTSTSWAQIQRERAAVDGWKRYLAWEEKNPLMLEDKAALQARQIAACRKAVMHMQFCPEIWYVAYVQNDSVGQTSEATAWLEKGLESCPGSFLLSFALIDHHERNKQTSACGPIFDNLIEHAQQRIETRRKEADVLLAGIDAETEAAQNAVKARKVAQGAGEELEGEEKELLRKQDEGRQEKKKAIEAQVSEDIEKMKEEASLIWIKQMQFLRRTEGIRPTRICFGKARKSSNCTWQVYEASAMIEYHCSKDTRVATNVFELAVKTFGTNEMLIVRYLDFLLRINDENNARALFERVITTLPPEKARPVWDRWAEYEYNFGDLAAITRLEYRLQEIFPEKPRIERLTERSCYGDLEVISIRDLGLFPTESSSPTTTSTVFEVAELKDQANTDSNLQADEQDAASGGKKRRIPGGTVGDTVDNGGRGASPGPGAVLTGPVKRLKANGVSGEVRTKTSPDVPPGIRFFLSMLPMKAAFDGPIMPADELINALRGANLPAMVPQSIAGPGGFVGTSGMPAGPGVIAPGMMPQMMGPSTVPVNMMGQPQHVPAQAQQQQQRSMRGRGRMRKR